MTDWFQCPKCGAGEDLQSMVWESAEGVVVVHCGRCDFKRDELPLDARPQWKTPSEPQVRDCRTCRFKPIGTNLDRCRSCVIARGKTGLFSMWLPELEVG